MNEIAVPAIPAGVILLLNFFAPYATALAVRPEWPGKYKQVIAIVISLALAALVLLLAFAGFGIVIPEWPILLLLAVAVSQASYDLVLKRSANAIALASSPTEELPIRHRSL